jgi:DNA-binding winged helix-turn-helix (wHTH) protein/TolB-like protein/Flp pilus assembly protein TadD
MTERDEHAVGTTVDAGVPLVTFGEFTLDIARASLLRGGHEIRLRRQAFDVLRYLVAHRGRVVGKDEILSAIWRNVHVTDDSLVQCVKEIRAALGDSAQQIIKTVPRRGYLFDLRAEEAVPSSAIGARAGSGSHPERAPRIGPAGLLGIAATVALLVVVSLLAWRAASQRESSVSAGHTIAVLPFRWLGSPPDEDYLGRGMANELINRLSGVRDLSVRPTSAVLQLPPDATAKDAAQVLGVEYVIEGHLQRALHRLSVSAQLVAPLDNRVLWAGQYEVDERDAFKAQVAIAERAALAITTQLPERDLRLLRRRDTSDYEAYVAYLTGQHYLSKRNEVALRQAIVQFERAVSRDPGFARAYAGLANAYDLMGAYGSTDPREAFRAATNAAATALKIDPESAEAMTALAFADAHARHDWKRAEASYRTALRLAPQYATAHQWLALCLAANGRMIEAIDEARSGLMVDPLSLIIHTDLGRHFYYARRFDDAIGQLKRTIELDPNFVRAHQELGRAYKQKGEYALAIKEIARAVDLSGRSASAVAELSNALAQAGDRSAALALLDELQSRAAGGAFISNYHLAVIFAALGDTEQAITSIEKAYDERFNWVVFANVEPEFDALRANPRFKALIARLGVGG